MVRYVFRKGSQPLAFGYVKIGISACRPSSQSFLRLLTRRLEECPAAIADHPVARAGGIAGIAQVEPDDAHAAAFCGGEHTPRTGTRPQALCGPRPPGSRRSIAAAVWRAVA